MDMTLTFEYTHVGGSSRRGQVLERRAFPVKSESHVQKDIEAWVKECYAKYLPNEQGRLFEVCRLHGADATPAWVCYGNENEINWNGNFMSWALMVMACTLNYLGWERDNSHIKGYHFVKVVGDFAHMRCESLEDIDRFVQSEMRKAVSEEEA